MSSKKPLNITIWIAATLAVAGAFTVSACLAERHLQTLIIAAQMQVTSDPSVIASVKLSLSPHYLDSFDPAI